MARVTSLIIIVLIMIPMIQDQVHGRQEEVPAWGSKKWIIPARRLMENKDYTKEKYIAKIRSDEEKDTAMRYTLRGKGATEEPYNIFTVDSVRGFIRINAILDREEIASYTLTGEAWFPNGTRAEEDIDVVVEVDDENDCSPVFSFKASQATGAVNETSAKATYVMEVTATDADLANTPHSQIAYTIVEQSPAKGGSMFYINQTTGKIYVRQNTLDRETEDTYSLTIKGTDMNGRPGGLSGTGKIVITILDVNDNIPTLERDNFEAKVMENTFNVTVLKMKALDADLIHSDNWLAVFTIVSGNEAGYFSITTDAMTNEGILILNKALDYDELKVINLQVAVSNKAEYHSSIIAGISAKTKPYPIKIHVLNEPEGPRFQPAVKVVQVSEDHTTTDLKKVITSYKAFDTDTLQYATNVIYAKGEDIENWITIDQHTAEIALNKLPDRESKYLVNGTYYVKIICISKDIADKTATGTIAIQVEDLNDNCPTLTRMSQTLCFNDEIYMVDTVYATAVDRDAYPNAAPFEFEIGPNTKEQWAVEHLNDTTVILRPKETLWPGFYKVFLVIRDHQGKTCDDQVLHLEVNRCTEDRTVLLRTHSRPSASLGPKGIPMLLLPLLLLFLLPLLLLFCLCGVIAEGFKAIPWEAKQRLIPYNTEGQGEDKEVPLLVIPTEVDDGVMTSANGLGSGVLKPSFNRSSREPELKQMHGVISLQHVMSSSQEVPLPIIPTEVDDGVMTCGSGLGSGVLKPSLHRSYINEPECQRWSSQVRRNPGRVSGQVGEEQCEQRYSVASEEMDEFEGIALSDSFLHEYYSNKASYFSELQSPNDALLIYNCEDLESLVGSIDCCSLLQDDQDPDFLNDLGPKFKTLADVCHGMAFEVESSKVTFTAENTDVPNQSQLIQQPIFHYLAVPPENMVDPNLHPTLFIGLTNNMGENLVMVERKNTTSGSSQLEDISQGVLGVDNLHGAQGLVLSEGRAYVPSYPQQVIDMFGNGEVVMVETQDRMGSSFVQQFSHELEPTVGNIGQAGCEELIHVAPSQIYGSGSLEVIGQIISGNVFF